MDIRPVISEDDLQQVRQLFRDYYKWISQEHGISLSFQGIETELEFLPGYFSPPDGCMLLAEIDSHTAGCVALRRLDSRICEMKRMYVKPLYRNKGIGRALGKAIIREARNKGYEWMRLDTLDNMKAAQNLYFSLGFTLTQQYYELPPEILKRAVFMEMSLAGDQEIPYRIIEKPAFTVIGNKTWISGQDNDLFKQFWIHCQEEGLFGTFAQINDNQPGKQTNSSVLGISCVEQDPANRAFFYLIAIEKPEGLSEYAPGATEGLETYQVPASKWAAFECVGRIPDAIVKSEIYAFTQWLPASEYEHANTPEMEVYFPGNDGQSADSYCEFWLPIKTKITHETLR